MRSPLGLVVRRLLLVPGRRKRLLLLVVRKIKLRLLIALEDRPALDNHPVLVRPRLSVKPQDSVSNLVLVSNLNNSHKEEDSVASLPLEHLLLLVVVVYSVGAAHLKVPDLAVDLRIWQGPLAVSGQFQGPDLALRNSSKHQDLELASATPSKEACLESQESSNRQ